MRIQFKAKRQDDATRWRDGGFTEGHTAYSVPVLSESHIVTPRAERTSREDMMFRNASRDVAKTRTESLMKANGLDPYRVFAEDADAYPEMVQIRPIGNGFMAEITLTLDPKGRTR